MDNYEQAISDPTSAVPAIKSRQYSRFVSVMKYFLPLIAALIGGLVIFLPMLKVENSAFSINISDVKSRDGDSLSIVNAKFIGADNKKQPFSITADLARNVLKGTEQIQLEMPKADIAINEGGWLVLSAKSGLYDQKKKSLNLTGNVNLFHDSGYEFTTTDAQINLKNGIALSNSPVNGQGPFGELMSQGIRIEEKGKRIFFSGKTKLIMSPKAFKE